MDQRARKIKRCRVCGDIAIGFNFNVVSCESCKSFFRRNVQQPESLKCNGDKNCAIDKSSRKNCSCCRMKKCFEIGMRKDIVFSRQKLAEVRAHVESICRINKNSTDLKSHEFAYLQEARNAVTVIHEEETDLPIGGIAQNMIQLVTLDASSLSRVIKCCQRLSAYTNLDQCDQLVLLNSFYPARAFVQGSYQYDLDKEGCYRVAEDNSTKARVLVKSSLIQSNTSLESYQIYQNFTQSLHRKMGNDPIIYDLIIAQLLFKNYKCTSNHEFIRYNHSLYRYLLRRYLENKYSNFDKAKDKFDSLMGVIDKVEDVHTVFKDIYYQIGIRRNKESDQLVDAFGQIHKVINSYFTR